MKRGHRFHTWHKRYAVLEDESVVYYKDEAKKHKAGAVHLYNSSTARFVKSIHKGNKCVLVQTDGRYKAKGAGHDNKANSTLLFHCDKEDETNAWLNAIRGRIAHVAATYNKLFNAK